MPIPVLESEKLRYWYVGRLGLGLVHNCTDTDTGTDIWNGCTSLKQKCFIGEVCSGMEYEPISRLHENIYKSVKKGIIK